MPMTHELVEGHDQPTGLLAEGITHAYIHEGALGEWASASNKDATNMLWFMGALKLSRIVGNILGPGGDMENAWGEGDGPRDLDEVTRTLLSSDERRYINPLLGHAGVSVISMDIHGGLDTPPLQERFVPIGSPLVSSCFDQDFHTYALSDEGNVKMRRDSGPMGELTAAMAAGTGPRDLALVHGSIGTYMRGGKGIYEFNAAAITRGAKAFGDYLVPVEPGIGPDGNAAYVRQPRPAERLPLEGVLEIDKIARSGITQIAEVRIRMVRDMVDGQRSNIGQRRFEGRVEQIEHLRGEVARVIGRHRLIREVFYPAA